MKSNQSRNILSRRPFVTATFAVLAGSFSFASLISGAACESASSNTVGFTGDELVTGNPRLQVAAREQVSSGSPQTNRDGVRSGAVSLEDDVKIARLTSRLLETRHYAQMPINDDLSPRVFDSFLDTLDPQRVFFLQTDVDALSTEYRDRIVGLTSSGAILPLRRRCTRFCSSGRKSRPRMSTPCSKTRPRSPSLGMTPIPLTGKRRLVRVRRRKHRTCGSSGFATNFCRKNLPRRNRQRSLKRFRGVMTDPYARSANWIAMTSSNCT
jgi:hypothetical protein